MATTTATARKKKISSSRYLGRRSNFLDLNQPTDHKAVVISDEDNTVFEFDESDVWNNFASSDQSQTSANKKPIPVSSRPSKKMSAGSKGVNKTAVDRPVVSSSLPLNVPDWSKILGPDSRKVLSHNRNGDRYDDLHQSEDNEGDDDYDEEKFPPHVYLARTRGASFSVHEGIGRTLKGRDLRRVRNAIWEKTGFQD